jgi:UDP-N-acetylmuramyl tripeptide synthase
MVENLGSAMERHAPLKALKQARARIFRRLAHKGKGEGNHDCEGGGRKAERNGETLSSSCGNSFQTPPY